MFPFLLYLLTAMTTGFQVFRVMSWAVWGRPVSNFEIASFLGSVGLLLAAFVSLFSARKGSWVALVSLVPGWALYGPVVFATIRQLAAGALESQSILLFHAVPPALLVSGTVYALLAAPFRSERVASSRLFFPAQASRVSKVVVLTFTGLLLLTVAMIFTFFIGNERITTYEMRWKYQASDSEEDQNKVKLIFVDFPSYYEVLYSQELAQYLESTGKPTVRATFAVTFDFGRVRGYRILRIEDWQYDPSVRWEGGSGCGDDLSPCTPENERGPSPWESLEN